MPSTQQHIVVNTYCHILCLRFHVASPRHGHTPFLRTPLQQELADRSHAARRLREAKVSLTSELEVRVLCGVTAQILVLTWRCFAVIPFVYMLYNNFVTFDESTLAKAWHKSAQARCLAIITFPSHNIGEMQLNIEKPPQWVSISIPHRKESVLICRYAHTCSRPKTCDLFFQKYAFVSRRHSCSHITKSLTIPVYKVKPLLQQMEHLVQP